MSLSEDLRKLRKERIARQAAQFQKAEQEKYTSEIEKLTAGYDPTANSQEGQTGWNDYVAAQERIAQSKAQSQEEKSWWEKLLGHLGDAGQDTSLPIHTTQQVTKGYQEQEAAMQKPDDRWSDEQRHTFGYLWNQSRQQAYQYAYTVNNMLNTQQEQAKIQQIQDAATDNFGAGAAHTVGAIMTAPSGMADYLGDIIAQGTLGYIPKADGQVTPNEYSQTVTGSISQNLNEKYGTIDERVPVLGGKGWGDVYNLGTSTIQSSLAAFSGGSGQALVQFFGSSAAAGVDDALSRGAEGNKAIAYGTMLGLAEGLAEALGIDNLLKIGASGSLRQLVNNLLKQGAAEGIEEGVTAVLGNFADNLIMGNKSNYYALVEQFRANGLSEEKAKRNAWTALAEGIAFDMLGGFASGAAHAAPQTAYQTYQQKQSDASKNASQQPQRKPSLVDDIVNRITANHKNTATDARQSAEKAKQAYVDSLLDEVTAKATGAPADPIGAAVEAFKTTGTVTDKQAADILGSVRAVSHLVEKQGFQMPENTAHRPAAVKQAIADLAQKQAAPPVDTETKTDYDNKNTQGGIIDGTGTQSAQTLYRRGDTLTHEAQSRTRAETGHRSGIQGVVGETGKRFGSSVPVRQRHGLTSEAGDFNETDYIAPNVGSALHEVQNTFRDAGIECRVVKASSWGRENSAYSNKGIVYISEGIDPDTLATAFPHESTHIMKQDSFAPYLDFAERTPDMLDLRGANAAKLINLVATHREIDIFNMSQQQLTDLYDELNAIVYGMYKGGILSNSEFDYGSIVPGAFTDFEGYIQELESIHDQFRRQRNAPGSSVFASSETTNEAESTPTGESPKTGSLATPKDSASADNIEQPGENVNTQNNTHPSPDESVGADEQSGYGPNTVGGAESKFKREQRKSKLYTNTYANTSDEAVRSVGEAAMEENPHIADYDYISEEESLYNARLRTRSARERNAEYTYLMKKDGWTGEDLDVSYELLKAFQKKGDTKRFHTLAAKQRSVLTDLGQAVQANAKYSRSATKAAADAHEALDELRPSQVDERYYVKKDHAKRNTFGKDVYYQTDTGKLAQDMGNMSRKEASASKRMMKEERFEQWKTSVSATILDVANAIENTAEGDVTAMREIVRSLARFRHTTAWFGTQSRLTRIAEKALQTVDFDTAKDIALAQLRKIPDDFKRRSVGQVVNTIRVHNMLGSLTTTMRNIEGNASIGILDAVSDSFVGRLADIAVSRFTGKRTVGNDFRHAKEYFKGGKKAAEMAALATELDIPIGSESRFSTGTTRTFSPQGLGPVMRYLSAFDKAMRYALEVSDRIFSGGTESAVEASLRDLGEKSNLGDDEIQALSARTGERRTFKDGRMLTRTAKGLKDALNNVSAGNIGAGDLVMPFVVTGSGVAHTAVDYSSGGLNGLMGIFRLVHDVKTGAYNSKTGIKKVKGLNGKVREVSLAEAQRQAVTNFGRGMTGVGLIAAFTALAAAGILKVHEDDDYDKNALEDSLGTSGAQINISAALRDNSGESAEWQDGDICVGMDFLEPFNAHMYIGHALSQEEDFSELIKAYPRTIVSGIWKSLLDMPMMQSLSDLNDLFVSEDAVDASGQLLGNLGSGFIPAALRQTAYMTDPYYRDTTGENAIEKAANQLKSYIPGFSQTLPKKYSGLGDEQLRHDSDVLGFFNTYINPGKISQISTNKIADSLEEIAEATGNKAIYPDYIAPGSFAYTDEDGKKQTVTLSGVEMTETYQKTYGKKVASLYKALLAMDEFDALDAETKADILESAKSYATQLARAAVSDYSEIPAYIKNKPENMSEAEAFVRQKLVGTTTMYTDLSISSAAYVSDLIKSILPEEGKDSVRKIQKLEAVAAADDRLSQQEQRSAMEDIIGDNSILEKYTKILEMGYDNDDFVESYRIDLDIEGENAKERTIKEFMRELGLPRAVAEKLYEAYHPPKKKGFQANLYT